MSDTTAFAVTFTPQRSRLTTFFRWFMAIPLFIVGAVYGFVTMFTVFAAWVVVSITGRYPEGLYGWHSGVARWSASVNGYYMLLTDDYPSFAPTADGHAVQLGIPPALPKYSRAKAFFRLLLAIPPLVVNYALGIIAGLCAFLAWFAIVITGRQPEGLQNAIELGISYQSRLNAYMLLLTESWPSITTPDPAMIPAAPAAGPLPGPARPAAPVSEQARPEPPNPFGH